MQILKETEEHLLHATTERSLYRTVCKTSKEQVKQFFSMRQRVYSSGTKLQSPPPCSADICVHYSFDMAQQVHYPANSSHQPGVSNCFWLPGTMYACSGVVTESLRGRQTMRRKAKSTCKGANTDDQSWHHFALDIGLSIQIVESACGIDSVLSHQTQLHALVPGGGH